MAFQASRGYSSLCPDQSLRKNEVRARWILGHDTSNQRCSPIAESAMERNIGLSPAVLLFVLQPCHDIIMHAPNKAQYSRLRNRLIADVYFIWPENHFRGPVPFCGNHCCCTSRYRPRSRISLLLPCVFRPLFLCVGKLQENMP